MLVGAKQTARILAGKDVSRRIVHQMPPPRLSAADPRWFSPHLSDPSALTVTDVHGR